MQTNTISTPTKMREISTRSVQTQFNKLDKGGGHLGEFYAAGMSIRNNFKDVWNDEISKTEFAKRVAVDAGKVTIKKSVTANAGVAIRNTMSGSNNGLMQSLGSNDVIVGIMAKATWEVGSSLNKWRKGEISAKECVSEIKEKSASLTVESVGAKIGGITGQVLMPYAPGVGAFIGAVAGSIITSVVCKECLTVKKQAKLAHEQRLAVEAQCAAAIEEIRACREEMQRIAAQYMSGYMQTFNKAFDMMHEAIMTDNIDQFMLANNLIVEKCGGEVQFHNMEEFNDIMNSDKPFIF